MNQTHYYRSMVRSQSNVYTGLTSIFSPLATSITPTSVDYSNVQSEKIVAQYINVTAISLLPSSNVDIVAEQSSLHQLLSSVIGSDLTTNIILSQLYILCHYFFRLYIAVIDGRWSYTGR
jgi:hypothetical protein